jgi:ribonuclease P protein component
MGKFSFHKEERLKKEKHIQELFGKGSSFYLFPFKVLLIEHPDSAYPFHQVLFSVSKRNFKRAVDRNLIRRHMREAYRLQKGILPAQPRLILCLIYTHKDLPIPTEIHKKLKLILERLVRRQKDT